MPVPAATGPIGKSLEHARESLANSSTFRTLVGAANATEAKTSIFLGVAPGDETTWFHAGGPADRPYALIHAVDAAAEAGSTSVAFDFTERTNTIAIAFERNYQDSEDDETGELYLTVINEMEGVQADLEAYTGTAGGLAFDRIMVAEWPMRPRNEDVDSVGQYVTWTLHLEWSGI